MRRSHLLTCGRHGAHGESPPHRWDRPQAQGPPHSATAGVRWRFRRKARATPDCDRRIRSRAGLDTLIRGAIVFMHHAKFLCKAEKAFGVTHKEIAARVQAVPELLDQAL